MSRRHSTRRQLQPSIRGLAAWLAALLALSALAPAVALAQGAEVSDQAIEQRWQLLSYWDADGDERSVPAGIGATLLLFANSARGEAACSTFESRYQRQGESLFIDPPSIERLACDAASEAFDEEFYRALGLTTSFNVSDSILVLRDATLQPLMRFTRAEIDQDPTVARWELTRIGDAEGTIEPVIPGLDPWAEFLPGGRLVGRTGCGAFLGSYRINDGTMTVTDVASRLGSCTDSARRQAEQMVQSLADVTDFQVLPAGLALRDANGATRLALAPAIDLGGRTWTPTAVYDADGTLLFDEERLNTSSVRFQGREVDGLSICRPFAGRSLSSGLALSTSGIKLEGQPCSKKGDLDAVETAFIQALELTSSHALRGRVLELKDVDGNTLLSLLPQPPLAGPTWVVTHLNLTPTRAKNTKRAPKPEAVITATFDDTGVLLGETGAGANFYSAFYRSPAAGRITVDDVQVDGRACGGKRAGSPACQQEQRFTDLLEAADSYIVREGELRLMQQSPQGRRPLLWFAPEVLEPSTP